MVFLALDMFVVQRDTVCMYVRSSNDLSPYSQSLSYMYSILHVISVYFKYGMYVQLTYQVSTMEPHKHYILSLAILHIVSAIAISEESRFSTGEVET